MLRARGKESMAMAGSEPPPGGYGSTPPPEGSWGGPAGYGGQPQGGMPPGGTPPPNHLVWAILSTLFCCLPLGIASIVFAAQVNSKYAAGDLAGAQESSNKARQFALWATIVGVVIGILYILLVVVLGVAGSTLDTTDY
jgi:predicted secreted protein